MSHRRRDKPVEQLRRTWTSTEDLEETLQGMFAQSTTPQLKPSDTCQTSLSTPVETSPVTTVCPVSTPVDTIQQHYRNLEREILSTPVETHPVETIEPLSTPVNSIQVSTPVEPGLSVSSPASTSPPAST